MNSYWPYCSPVSVWLAPHLPPDGHCTLGDGIAKSSGKVSYVMNSDLDHERRKMGLPVPLELARDTFLRASVRLICCDTHSSESVSLPNPKESGSWWFLTGLTDQIGQKLTEYVPGYASFSRKTVDIYQWMQNRSQSLSRRSEQTGHSRAAFLEKSSIRAISWHHKQATLVFADGLNSVILCSCDKIYPSANGLFSKTLAHSAQKRITSLTWDAFCDFRLGVCCLQAILIWDLNPKTPRSTESPLLVIEPWTDGLDFVSILFTSNLTLLAAAQHGKLREYDMFSPDTEQSIGYHDISQLVLSPDRSFIAYCDTNGHIGIMKEDGFDSIIQLYAGAVVTFLTWLPDSTGIIFSPRNSGQISLLPLRPPVTPLGLPGKCHEITLLGRFSSQDPEDVFFRDTTPVDLVSLCLDDQGRHLVVVLQNQSTLATRCLVCRTQVAVRGTLSIRGVCGWIVLPGDDVPILSSFFPSRFSSDQQGSFVSVASRGGVISHFPLIIHDPTEFPVESSCVTLSRTELSSPKDVFLRVMTWLTLPVFQWLKHVFTAGGRVNAEYVEKNGFSSDLAHVSLRWPTAGQSGTKRTISSFVEKQASKPERSDLRDDILNRTLSPSPDRDSVSPFLDRSSDHHMSVDLSPYVQSKPSNPFSPLAVQVAGLVINGPESRPSYGGQFFPLTKSVRTKEESADVMGLPTRLTFSE